MWQINCVVKTIGGWQSKLSICSTMLSLENAGRVYDFRTFYRQFVDEIKTSTYFLHISPSASHDFYIVRFAERGRIYTVVVMLQPSAWDEINGDTIDGHVASVLQQLTTPVRIHSDHYEFVGLAYDEWKRRILTLYGKV